MFVPSKKRIVMNLKSLQKIAFSIALLFVWNFGFSQCSATLSGGGTLACTGELVPLTFTLTGDGPWTIEWQNDGVVQAPVTTTLNQFILEVNVPGLYELISVSTPTCPSPSGTVSGEALVTFSDAINFGCNGQVFASCENLNLGCNVSGGSPPYLFEWSNGSTDPNPTIFISGVYEVTITDINGCTTLGAVTVEIVDFACSATVSGELSCVNPTVTLSAGCLPNIPVAFSWENSNGILISTEPVVTVFEADTYTLQAIDLSGNCEYVQEIVVEEGTEDCGVIMGQIIVDENDDCLTTSGEEGLGGWLIKAEEVSTGEEFLALADTNGNYSISVLPGDYTVDVINPASTLWLPCETAVAVTLDDPDDVETVDFRIQNLFDCPLMQVDIGTPFLRRCFDNIFHVDYCNLGTVTAEDAYIEVTLDPLLIFESASIPWSGPVGNVYTFDIGDVETGDCGSFSITAEVSCNALLGENLCAEAHVFPDSICAPSIPGWTGASLEITSDCIGDDLVFTITNVGNGPMDEPLVYIVIEDGVMMMEENDGPTLGPGQTHTVTLPANGATYVLDVAQVANHPGDSDPLLAVEGCGVNNMGTFSIGFAGQFPENDGNPFISIECHETIGAYDPNDKRGFPLGFGDEHFIEPGQDLEYHIRFQNTGTDTAFNVRIEDVISDKLDLTTFRPGASSHFYEMDFRGDTAVFLFPNILLPDSNVNEPLSHGFVKFKINQKVDNEIGDVIENTAGIFFDFNEPIITNTTVHRLGEDFILSPTFEAKKMNVELSIRPHPAFGETTLHLLGDVPTGEITFTLFDLTGKHVGTQNFISPTGKIDLSDLGEGLYFFQINSENEMIGVGKLLVNEL